MTDAAPSLQFATDDQLAARLRAVETTLLALELRALASELAAVAGILDPQPESQAAQ
jgi:hypothetical protein